MTTDHTPPAAETLRDQILHALDFAYCQGIGYQSPEELLAAYDASRTPPAEQTAFRDRIRRAICEAEGFMWNEELLEPDEYGEVADAVLAVLPPPVSRADVIAATVRACAEHLRERYADRWTADAVDSLELNAARIERGEPTALLRRMADEAQPAERRCTCSHPADEHSVYGCEDDCGCEWMPKRKPPMDPAHILGIAADEAQPGTEATCVCGHPTRLHHEDVCLLTDCGCANSLEISALPEALEAVLTKRFTELGNQFAEMRVHEQGPDGWPSSRLVSPHMVADILRELMRRAADDGPTLRLPNHTVNEEEGPDPAEAQQDGARP
ncbi:hypothetical protein ACFW2V_02860 [Streptomyces sp. NPDC058947]|uniref:hypothetical protein n=1 Tax=Streptomyces sp. NPDC058947 TaxID=3346675 RepID=UPI00367C7C82